MAKTDLSVLVNAVVDDPEVKSAVKSLALTALAEAKEVLITGNPQSKQNVMRMLMPALVASLKETTTGDGLESLRDTQNALFAAMRDADTP